MTREELTVEFERLLQGSWTYNSDESITVFTTRKNRVYEFIKPWEYRSIIYKGGYFVGNDDLIAYLVDHCIDKNHKKYTTLRDTED